MQLVSATQISSYGECKRKWALRSVAKVTTEEGTSQRLGTEVDNEQLQPYLKDGRTFDYSRDSGYIAASALAFLPAPQAPGLEVQKHFVMPSPSWRTHAFGYQGYIDLWLPDSSVMPDIPTSLGYGIIPCVSDFKTTSNLRYQKSPEVLGTDVQAMLYGTWAMFETKARVVDLAWIYMQTRGAKKAKRTYLRVLGQHVAEQFKRIDETACEMFDMRKALEEGSVESALTAEPNWDHCDAYGGCAYRGLCGPKEFQVEIGNQEEVNMGLGFMSKLKKDAEAVKGAETPAPPPAKAEGPAINPPESKLVSGPDPLGADIAAYTKVDEVKATKKREKATPPTSSDAVLIAAFKAAAKAFLEALS